MPEPTLGELTNLNSDASLGNTGLTAFVPIMKEVNAHLFQYAQNKAAYDWQKYTQFLQNYKDVVKQGTDIADMDTAAPDKEHLKNKMAEIFSTIEKDPKSALGGKGMFDLQNQLQKLTADATQSKQDNAFDFYHRKFLELYPTLATDENKSKVTNFLPGQKLGERQPYILDQPQPEFDGDTLFSGILKNSTHPFAENFLNPKDDNDKVLEGYIKTVSGDEVNPKAVAGLWNLAYDGHPEIKKSVDKRYNNLPPEVKERYDKVGGAKTFFSDLGKSYLQGHFPDGTYESSKEGNFRFNKKSELKNDPNYLSAQRLAAEITQNKAKNAIDWYNATHKFKPDVTPPEEDKDGNIIYGVNGSIPGTDYELKNGAIIDKASGNVMPLNGDYPVPASYFDNAIFTEFNKYAGAQKMVKDADGNTVPNEAINPARLAENGSDRIVRFKDGVIDGIKTDKGDYANVEQFKYITNQANIKGVKKYQKQIDISGGKNQQGVQKVQGKTGKPIYIPQ